MAVTNISCRLISSVLVLQSFVFFVSPFQLSCRRRQQRYHPVRRHKSVATTPLYISNTDTASQGGSGIFYDGGSDFGGPNYNKDLLRVGEDAGKKEQQSSSSSIFRNQNNHMKQTRDIVIIGGGLAGLSAALFTKQMSPERHVTILEREDHILDETKKATTVSSFAAAGMLAPQSERLPKGPLLDLCVESRRMYKDFINLVESLAQDPEGEEYLYNIKYKKNQKGNKDNTGTGSVGNDSNDKLKPWSVGYMSGGGFLAPAFAGDNVATWSPPDEAGSAIWLDQIQVHELEPNLHPSVIGGWWFPEDVSVDARRLTCSLRAACVASGVQLLCGDQYDVSSLDLVDGRCNGLWLQSGKYISCKSLLVANGAWMRQLLPVPIEPHKGQSLSLQMPPNSPSILKRVLFAQDTYIVPKADGRLVIGATVEAGSFSSDVTPSGIMHCLNYALQLVPSLANLPIEETWVGLRPTTPDKGPILGKTPWENLFLAGGYWRNGVLLAPKTAQLVASLLSGTELSSNDQALLDAFAWDRFISSDKATRAKLAANTRYASAMHPVQRRSDGVGVAAAVGTELGTYSLAKHAKGDREKDRRALFGSASDAGEGTEDDALERAAQLGMNDAFAFTTTNSLPTKRVENNDDNDSYASITETPGSATRTTWSDLLMPVKGAEVDVESSRSVDTVPIEGQPSAITVGASSSIDDDDVMESSRNDDSNDDDLAAMYRKIQENQSKRNIVMESGPEEQRADPGFRIYHIDDSTGEKRLVPPYTTPQKFQQTLVATDDDTTTASSLSVPQQTENNNNGNDSILNGYQAIIDSNADKSLDETRQSMREARIKNRIGNDDESGDGDSILGTLDLDDDLFPSKNEKANEFPSGPKCTDDKSSKEDVKSKPIKDGDDLKSVYDRIRLNKSKQTFVMEETTAEDERPDPGFRIYHVDEATGDERLVPPYTTPQAFQQMIANSSNEKSITSVASDSRGTSSTRSERTKVDSSTSSNQKGQYNEKTFDGYTAITEANSDKSYDEVRTSMKSARQKNRIGSY